MKYLYTLTSTQKDNYYEQFLLSVTSLKLNNPNSFIILLCDNKTRETLTGKRREYERFVSDLITSDVPSDFNQIEVSRWIKTSMRRLVTGDFLFIDCDTVITDDLSSVVKLGIVIGACLDKHALINRHHKKNMLIDDDKRLGFCSYKSNRHINSGVIYCIDNEDTRKLFDRWHELWLYSKSKNILRDQPSFNMAIYENESLFTELNGIWNCQISYNSLPYLADSKIIHYFASNMYLNQTPFLPADDKILNQIKITGQIPDNALELLKNPRSAFTPDSQIIAGNDILSVLNSNLFQFLIFLKKKLPSLFNIFDKILYLFKKPAKKVIGKYNSKKEGKFTLYN